MGLLLDSGVVNLHRFDTRRKLCLVAVKITVTFMKFSVYSRRVVVFDKQCQLVDAVVCPEVSHSAKHYESPSLQANDHAFYGFLLLTVGSRDRS